MLIKQAHKKQRQTDVCCIQIDSKHILITRAQAIQQHSNSKGRKELNRKEA